MPYYDFHCQKCGRKARLFIAYVDYDAAQPACPACQSTDLRRLVTRVALGKSEESRLEALQDDRDLAALEDDDPRALGRYMRRMSQELGEEPGGEFDEIVERLEQGQSPEAIEEDMPSLASASDDD